MNGSGFRWARHCVAAAIVSAATWPCAVPTALADGELGAAQYRILPLRVHLLHAQNAPELNCQLKDADVRRIAGKINGVWKQAGIQFYLESIVSEDAAAQELYHGIADRESGGALRIVRPAGSRSDQVFHVYYIRDMAPNGICIQLSRELIFVKDTARLRPVEGGIDEPLPRVSAHELGHALGLPHRQDRTNLMASGTTGTSLNQEEIETARKSAEMLSWRLTPEDALKLADRLVTEGKRSSAAAIYSVLSGLPDGDIPREAKRKLSS